MNRLPTTLAALLASWLGLVTPATGAEAMAMPAPAAAYTYDALLCPAVPTCTTSERGPPAAYDRNADYDADGQLSLGASARPNVTTTTATYDYDNGARFVHSARGSHDAEEPVDTAVAGPVVFQQLNVAANGGSALSRASQADFRAADDPASIFVKNKHLASAGGNGAKFATDDIGQVQGLISRGLQSDGMQFLPNQLDDTFRAIVPGGGVVGTRGQEFIRVIVTGDGRVINAFPVNVR